MLDTPSVCLILTPLNDTFERKCLWLPSWPQTLRIGRQTNSRTTPATNNGFFDSKVLSRAHAEIWSDPKTGSVFIRDIQSSNGTFLNGQRLSQENQTSEPFELRTNDVLELGIDILNEEDQSILHRKVASRIEYAGWAEDPSNISLNDSDELWIDTNTTDTFDTVTPRVLIPNQSIYTKAALPNTETHTHESKNMVIENLLEVLNKGLKTAKQQAEDIAWMKKMLNNMQEIIFSTHNNNISMETNSNSALEEHLESIKGSNNLKEDPRRFQPINLEILASKQLEIEEKIMKIKQLEKEREKEQTYKQFIRSLLKEQKSNEPEMKNELETKENLELFKNQESKKEEESKDALKTLENTLENVRKEMEVWKYRAKRTEKIVEQSTYYMAALLKVEKEEENDYCISSDTLWPLFFPACCVVMIGMSIMCYLNSIENLSLVCSVT